MNSNPQLCLPTVREAAAVIQHGGAAEPGPGGLIQGRALRAAPGPVLISLVFPVQVLDLVLVPVPVLVVVQPRPEHASEDFLIQPGLAALRDVAQEASQRTARPPPAPENSER